VPDQTAGTVSARYQRPRQTLASQLGKLLFPATSQPPLRPMGRRMGLDRRDETGDELKRNSSGRCLSRTAAGVKHGVRHDKVQRAKD